ncbi:hypothetical protein FHS21_003429 [Phyllobacterium trifolii]|uniref:Uncharacterized protein n=1 Tax=Phyllobacterium trifolii TaxID=300193 RepID=A0A839UAV8_9HYPH|nr:hypothetical protein [Phyllobacterium trifolii]MBB3147013.1 hypothetical protein [Phyllobacterium trifolii]
MTILTEDRNAGTSWFRTVLSSIAEIANCLSAAKECALAIENRRTPPASALQTLGIDPASLKDVFKRS